MAYTNIKKPSDYFETTTYTGGATDVSSLSFQPDFVWAKKRDGVENHGLFDAVRGATETLNSNTTSAESTRSGSLTSFDSDGWSMGGSDGIISASGSTYVGWAWKANGAGSANTDGSISSTVSVNTTSGFSIVSYTGNGANNDTATIGHGLGVAPSMIIVKGINATASWITTNTINGWNNVLELNSTAANAANTYAFGSTGIPPTSTVFTVAAASGQHHTNTNGDTYIAYCFNDVQGYSKFGSYIGNGNADGSFIYTGFSPAFVMIKETTGTGKWVMKDNRRTGINVNQSTIYANETEAEGTPGYELIDLLSNGFKQRGTGSYVNGSGTPYIYMAFAEQPLVGTNNIPATAR